MIATTEEQRLLEKWQKKLCLQEWRIKLVTHLRPEEMSVSNATGCTDWSESIKTARIEIINPACYGDRIVPFNFEKTLVHELLHLKFSFWCQDEYSVADMVKNNLNVTAVANTLPMQRNTVLYHLDKIERETKLNPRHIHDLIDLLEIALEVL